MGAWTETIQLCNVEGFNMESRADIVECLLALGWVYVNGQPEVKTALNFVTRMVPWIEQGLDEFMINSNGVIPIPVVHRPFGLHWCVFPLANLVERRAAISAWGWSG